jgi:hypothetical protein
MDNLQSLTLDTLLDLLNEYTNQYMKMLKDGSTQEEYDDCKEMMGKLTTEIELRKSKPNKDNQATRSRSALQQKGK